MGQFLIGMVCGGLLVFVIHSKMDNATRHKVDTQVAATVDSAASTTLDATQTGLAKANDALAKARANNQ